MATMALLAIRRALLRSKSWTPTTMDASAKKSLACIPCLGGLRSQVLPRWMANPTVFRAKIIPSPRALKPCKPCVHHLAVLLRPRQPPRCGGMDGMEAWMLVAAADLCMVVMCVCLCVCVCVYMYICSLHTHTHTHTHTHIHIWSQVMSRYI